MSLLILVRPSDWCVWIRERKTYKNPRHFILLNLPTDATNQREYSRKFQELSSVSLRNKITNRTLPYIWE